MVRIAVTAYLILVALVGPGLCCCNPLRLLAGCPRHGHMTHGHMTHGSSEGQRGSSDHCGCKHGHPSQPSPESQSPPLKDSPSCPCHDHETIPGALLAADLGSVKDFSSLKLQPVTDAAFLVVPTGQALQAISPASAEALPAPFLTPREMLRALQIMRC